MRPVEIVDRLCPAAKSSYRLAVERGDDLFKSYGVVTPLRMSHFLAQIFHESGGLSIEWESGAYSARRLKEVFGWNDEKQRWNHSAHLTDDECRQLAHNGPAIFERVYGLGNPGKARELGNTQPGDGWRYRGGGLMQTTGRDNYRRIGQKIGVDLVKHPEHLLLPEHALKPALVEWQEGSLNTYADNDNLLAISRKINLGNVNSSAIPNGLADRQAWYSRIRPIAANLQLDGAVEPAPPPPSPSGKVVYPLLKRGSVGPAVKRLQELLNAKDGLSLLVDGVFGDVTKAAVRSYQTRNGLTVDGIVGNKTWSRLEG